MTTGRPVATTVDELLAGATRRAPFRTAESRSAAHFERVWLDGEAHVVKYVHLDHDFAMRAAGDLGCLPLRAWRAGLFDAAPDVIDHAAVGMAAGHGRNGWGAAILMRDVSAELVPAGDEPLPEAQHEAFLDHCAALSAQLWGWCDELGLLAYERRWQFFDDAMVAAERGLGWPEPVPRLAAEGWARFAARVPADIAEGVEQLHRDVTPLVDALHRTPSTFLHGDWKLANLGTAADGRTILLDWAYPGEGPVAHELAWYLSLNRVRLPRGHTKETTVVDFRSALERHGVDTAPWWDEQLGLCLLGNLIQFGWEKALGDSDDHRAELGWWCDRAREGLARL